MKKLGLIMLLTLTSFLAQAESQDPTSEKAQNLCFEFNNRSEGYIKCRAKVNILIEQIRLDYIVYYVSDHTNENLNKVKLQNLVNSAAVYHPLIISKSVAQAINSVADLEKLKELLSLDLDAAIFAIYNSTPIVEPTIPKYID